MVLNEKFVKFRLRKIIRSVKVVLLLSSRNFLISGDSAAHYHAEGILKKNNINSSAEPLKFDLIRIIARAVLHIELPSLEPTVELL